MLVSSWSSSKLFPSFKMPVPFGLISIDPFVKPDFIKPAENSIPLALTTPVVPVVVRFISWSTTLLMVLPDIVMSVVLVICELLFISPKYTSPEPFGAI